MAGLGVVFGGPSPEHDISILTGLQAARALAQAGTDVVCVYWTKAGAWRRIPVETEADAFLAPEVAGASELELQVPGGFVEVRRRRSANLELDTVLNCCHGGPGEDGTLTGLLSLAGLRVTGPKPQSCALAMDKLATAALAESVGVPSILSVLVTADGKPETLPPTPWVVKPRFGGSSLGVEAGVADLETARALARQGVGRAGTLIQPMLEGWTDLNVAVRTHPQLEISEIERPLRDAAGIYGYHDKYLAGGDGMESAPRELPAQIPAEIRERIGSHAAAIADAFDLTGAPRIDFLWDGADALVLCEVNSIPGAWGAYLWAAGGIDRAQLYHALVAEARSAALLPPQWSASSDGQALRVAGTIAGKLA
jgi:D-alanine-D-alanine ligase